MSAPVVEVRTRLPGQHSHERAANVVHGEPHAAEAGLIPGQLACQAGTATHAGPSKEGRIIELGSLADWVGALGTAGALFATLHIISSDRKRAKSADAEAVSVWCTQRYVDHAEMPASRFINVHVFNGSSAPLPTVTAYSRVEGRDYIDEVLSSAGANLAAIEPGATVVKEIPVVHYVDVDRVFVFFITKDGQRWARRLGDGRLMTGIRARHLAEGAKPARAAWARSSPSE